MAKDVIVVVQRDALPTEKESLDILLVSTTGSYPVGVYKDIDSVKAVYGPDGPCPNPKIVRKATSLFNQEGTSIAESRINEFKIVSFDPPQTIPPTAAMLAITFTGNFSVPSGKNLWVKIGNDDKAVVEITADSEITSASQFANLFSDTSFTTKNGKTYTAEVMDNTVYYTAAERGEIGAVSEVVSIFEDEDREIPFDAEQICEFINGVDEISAADNLISEIKQFQSAVDNDWYYLLTDRDDNEYITALAKFAESSELSEEALGTGAEEHRKFYMGQTCDKTFSCSAARAAVIYTDEQYLSEEPDASYTGSVGPFYPRSVTWKFKRPQNSNAGAGAGTKLISLPQLTDVERNQLLENHINYLTEEYRHQYVKEGVCLNGEFIDAVLGGDWIVKRMRDLLYDVMLENANISYDDSGFSLISTAVLQALEEAVGFNIIAVDPESKTGIYNVTIPKYSESTEEQRRNRVMPDIPWEAQLSGSVHQVKTKGVLRISL